MPKYAADGTRISSKTAMYDDSKQELAEEKRRWRAGGVGFSFNDTMEEPKAVNGLWPKQQRKPIKTRNRYHEADEALRNDDDDDNDDDNDDEYVYHDVNGKPLLLQPPHLHRDINMLLPSDSCPRYPPLHGLILVFLRSLFRISPPSSPPSSVPRKLDSPGFSTRFPYHASPHSPLPRSFLLPRRLLFLLFVAMVSLQHSGCVDGVLQLKTAVPEGSDVNFDCQSPSPAVWIRETTEFQGVRFLSQGDKPYDSTVDRTKYR